MASKKKFTLKNLPEFFSVRAELRKNATPARSTYKVEYDRIVVIEGWNPRKEFEGLEELADDIFANGLQDPLRGDLSKDGKTFFLRDGERRYRAIGILRKRGVDFNDVEFFPYSPKMTEADKLVVNLNSDKKSKYKPIETAEGILRLKVQFELSNDDIAKRVGMSRQWVDGMIKLAKVPVEVKKEINDGKKSATSAIQKPVENDKLIINPGDKIIAPKELSLQQDLMSGVAPASSLPTTKDRNIDVKDIPASEGNKNDALSTVNFEKEETDMEKTVKEVLKLINKIEPLGKGLNEQAQKDLEGLLFFLRQHVDIFKVFFSAGKNKSVRVGVGTINELIKNVDANLVSDGYHTFGQLYDHRIAIYIRLCKTILLITPTEEGSPVWKTKVHSDGTSFDGWFVLGLFKDKGHQITYHIPEKYWDMVPWAVTIDKAYEFDGHTSSDVIERLLSGIEK